MAVVAPHFRPDFRRAQIVRALAEDLPDEPLRIGAWNAGLPGYWMSFARPRVRVLNLDGVVNNRVTALVDEPGVYEAYLLSSLDRIVEPPDQMYRVVPPERTRAFRRRHLRCGLQMGHVQSCEVVGGALP